MKKSVLFALCTLLSGCGNYASINQQSIESIQYRCDEGPLQVQRDDVNKKISLSVEGKQVTLSQGISAVGQRYSDGVYAFWSDGNNVATIYNHDWIISHNCLVQPESEAKDLTFEAKLQRWFGGGYNNSADLAQ